MQFEHVAEYDLPHELEKNASTSTAYGQKGAQCDSYSSVFIHQDVCTGVSDEVFNATNYFQSRRNKFKDFAQQLHTAESYLRAEMMSLSQAVFSGFGWVPQFVNGSFVRFLITLNCCSFASAPHTGLIRT